MKGGAAFAPPPLFLVPQPLPPPELAKLVQGASQKFSKGTSKPVLLRLRGGTRPVRANSSSPSPAPGLARRGGADPPGRRLANYRFRHRCTPSG